MANTTKDLFVFANLDGQFVPAGQLQVDEEGSRLIALHLLMACVT